MVLVGYWPMNENSGSTAYDVRNGNDGNIYGATIGVSGILGTTAYDFVASNSDYVGDLGITLTGEWSLCAWINADDVSSEQAIISNSDDSSNNWNWALEIQDSQLKYLNRQSGSGNFGKLGGSLSTGTWYHLVIVYDNAGTMYGFVDGVEVGNDSFSDGSQSNGGHTDIAKREDNDIFYDGRLAHARVYNHALTKQEVKYLYQVGSRGLHTSDKRAL